MHICTALSSDKGCPTPEHGRGAVADRAGADALVPEAVQLARAGKVQALGYRACMFLFA